MFEQDRWSWKRKIRIRKDYECGRNKGCFRGWCNVRVHKSAGRLWGAGPGGGDELFRGYVSILSLPLSEATATPDPPPRGPTPPFTWQSTCGPSQPGETRTLPTLLDYISNSSIRQGESLYNFCFHLLTLDFLSNFTNSLKNQLKFLLTTQFYSYELVSFYWLINHFYCFIGKK